MLNMDWKSGCAADGETKRCMKIIITGDWVPCWSAEV